MVIKDTDNLYLFFKCFTKDMSKIRATISGEKRDIKEIWREDGIEVFLDPGCRYFTYYQLMVNVNGALTDMEVNIKGEKIDNIDWNSDAEIRTKKFSDHWTAEIKIPLKNFANNDIWGINFCRNDSQEKGTNTLWSPTIKPSLGNRGFGVPEKFGKLILNKNPDTFRIVKTIKGDLVFEPLGVESKITMEFDRSAVEKKLGVMILNEENKKIFGKEINVDREKIEIPFLIYQDNTDSLYYLNIKCGELEMSMPFKFLTKDINFFVFPAEGYLIYSPGEKEARLNGNLKISPRLLQSADIKMDINLKEISTGKTILAKQVKVLSENFQLILPLKNLYSGGYILETSVEINPETILKTSYKFLKL